MPKLFSLPIIAAAMWLAGCVPSTDPGPGAGTAPVSPVVSTSDGTPVRIWGTIYYQKEIDADPSGNGVPLRDMQDRVIGPEVTEKNWCLGAIEGSIRVNGAAYDFAGTRDPAQASCPGHRPSERVRWAPARHPFGMGNKGNPLIPFRTVACDQGTVAGSKPWIGGKPAKFGQKIFIPRAKGTVLPDGTIHDGIFECGDTGGLITGNHLDFFIGPVRGGNSEAARRNPFAFISNSPESTVEAFILP